MSVPPIPPSSPVPATPLSLCLPLETDILVESALEDPTDNLEAPAEADDALRAEAPLAATAAAAAPAEVDEDVACRGRLDDAALSKDDDEAVSLGRKGLDADRWNSTSNARRLVT